MMKTRMLVTMLVLAMAGAVFAAEPVDINTASAAELSEAIKGVGMKKARAIVDYRTEHGPFKSVDDLSWINGIGETTVNDNRENLTVSTSGS